MRSRRSHLAIDLMGGDTPPSLLYEGVLKACDQGHSHFSVLVTPDIASALTPHPHVEFVLCAESISMPENPLQAVRHKKDSSMMLGLHLLKEKKVDAFISTGNTGALIAGSIFILSLKPGIERPALLARVPKNNGYLYVLDVGAHLQASSEQLEQYAYLGIDYLKNKKQKKIRLGLLNIGSESIKGHASLRETHQRLQTRFENDPQIQFVGNVEGRDPFTGDLDLLVTDGFSGNVFLKTAEGATTMLLEALRQETDVELSDNFMHRFDYRYLPGAILYGVQGTVIKCHGNATPEHLYQSILSINN